MRQAKPTAWQSSEQWRSIGRAAIREWNSNRWRMPKCGAARKSDGQPCQNLLHKGAKRCRVHGGKTGKGAQWHVHLLPDPNAADLEKKFARKLKQQERDARRKKIKLATMTATERERHEAWQRTHKPGSAAERERRRLERKQAAEVRASLARVKEPVVTPERAELDRQLKELEAEQARLAILLNSENNNLGVFG